MLNSRYTLRLTVEMGVFFVIPAITAGYFYVRVIVRLLKQEKRAARNRQLSIAFFASWLLWVVCWTPSYVVSFMNLSHYQNFDTLKGQWDVIIGYLAAFRVALQMLYCHLNPFVYLIILKKFQEHHIFVFQTFSRFMFSTRVRENPRHNKVVHRGKEISTKTKNKVALKLAVFVIVIISIILQISFLAFFMNQNPTRPIEVASKPVKRVTSNRVRTGSDFVDLKIVNNKPKIICSENHGTFKWHLKRCFFVVTHSPNGLNFTEQQKTCQQKGAILSYPRFGQEVGEMWNFFEKEMQYPEPNFYRNITLIMGFKLVGFDLFSNVYHSIDGKMLHVGTSSNPDWFRKRQLGQRAGRMSPALHSPAVCITKAKFISECMPNMLRKYSICSEDLTLQLITARISL